MWVVMAVGELRPGNPAPPIHPVHRSQQSTVSLLAYDKIEETCARFRIWFGRILTSGRGNVARRFLQILRLQESCESRHAQCGRSHSPFVFLLKVQASSLL